MSILENVSLKDERYTNIFTTHKEKLDSFVFRDTDDNIIGEIKCEICYNKKSYEIIKELPYEYIGQLDFMAFLLMYIYFLLYFWHIN